MTKFQKLRLFSWFESAILNIRICFEFRISCFGFLLLPNYLSIQVAEKKFYVKTFSRELCKTTFSLSRISGFFQKSLQGRQVVPVPARLHLKDIFIPSMKCMKNLHGDILRIIDDAFQENPGGTGWEAQKLCVLPRENNGTKGLD